MQATYPDDARVKLKKALGTIPKGSKGTVDKTVFIGTDEFCDVDFDDIPGDSTILVPVGHLEPA